jgi:hypothetical protein
VFTPVKAASQRFVPTSMAGIALQLCPSESIVLLR